jgi:hypothetical protein
MKLFCQKVKQQSETVILWTKNPESDLMTKYKTLPNVYEETIPQRQQQSIKCFIQTHLLMFYT